MYKDYIGQIVQYYEQKKVSGTLSSNLLTLKPAQLKDECLIVCAERCGRNDEQILRTFFGKIGDQYTYPRIIERFDINKFKPLINFLKGRVVDTDEKNIELLAWLIGFNPRPFHRWKNENPNSPGKDPVDAPIAGISKTEPIDPTETPTSSPESTGAKNASVKPGTSTSGSPVNQEEGTTPLSAKLEVPANPGYHFNPITIPVAIMALVLMAVIFYQYIVEQPGKPACMYWTGDHYQSIPCNQKVYGSLVIPLDTERQVHFKRITRPDTITEAGINRVSYIRLNGDIEFYTRKGDHPVYTERTLNPLTEHIYQKHILPLKQE